jgi:hypothetical protein
MVNAPTEFEPLRSTASGPTMTVWMTFHVADLFVELILPGIGLLALCSRRCRKYRASRPAPVSLQPPTGVGWTPNSYVIWAAVLCA